MGVCDSLIGNVPAIWVTCKAKDAVGKEVEAAAEDVWTNIVDSFAKAAGEFVKSLATGWLGIDSPELSAGGGPVGFIFGHTGWLVAQLSVLILLLTAGRMAWTQRAEGARDAAAAGLRVLLAQGTLVTAVNMLLVGGDKFSVWIVNASTQCGGDQATTACNKAFAQQVATMTLLNPGAGAPLVGLTLVVSLLLILASVVQIGFMLCRNAMVIVLVSTMPLAAAVSGTEMGKGWWRKSCAWLLAFILFKPVAGIVYSAGFASLTKGGDGNGEGAGLIVQMSGVVLLVLSALALPALMRIATPLVESVAQGRGGSTAGALGTLGAIASGAVTIKTGGASRAATATAGRSGGAAAQGSRTAGPGNQQGRRSRPSAAQNPTGAPNGSPRTGQPADPRTSQGTGPTPQGTGSTRTTTRTQPHVTPPRQSDSSDERGPSGSA